MSCVAQSGQGRVAAVSGRSRLYRHWRKQRNSHADVIQIGTAIWVKEWLAQCIYSTVFTVLAQIVDFVLLTYVVCTVIRYRGEGSVVSRSFSRFPSGLATV